MPSRCVVQGCPHTPGFMITLHGFPKDDKLRKAWIAYVQHRRKWNPTPNTSHICSAHFAKECFENWGQVKAGASRKLILKRDAIPGGPMDTEEAEVRTAVKKRELQRVSIITRSHYVFFQIY